MISRTDQDLFCQVSDSARKPEDPLHLCRDGESFFISCFFTWWYILAALSNRRFRLPQAPSKGASDWMLSTDRLLVKTQTLSDLFQFLMQLVTAHGCSSPAQIVVSCFNIVELAPCQCAQLVKRHSCRQVSAEMGQQVNIYFQIYLLWTEYHQLMSNA